MKVISGTKYQYVENYHSVLSIYKLHIFQSKQSWNKTTANNFIENG